MLQLITWIIFFHFPVQRSNFDGTTVYPHSGQLFAVMIPYLTVFYLYTTTKVRTEAKFEGINNWLLVYWIIFIYIQNLLLEKKKICYCWSAKVEIKMTSISYFKLYNDLILFSVNNWFLTVFQSQNYYHYSTGRLILIKKNNCY